MYDFDSGDLSLDFANTRDWHKSQNPVENLKSFTDLITWGEKAGLISLDEAQRLIGEDMADPAKFSAAYENAIQLREAIYRVFSQVHADLPIPEDDLTILNSAVRQANAHKLLCGKNNNCSWEWSPGIDGVDRLIWSVALAAADLLTSPTLPRVRVCEDDRGCGYLFIDQTKNHSRRWCSMESCGNRAKARRHYSRLQAG